VTYEKRGIKQTYRVSTNLSNKEQRQPTVWQNKTFTATLCSLLLKLWRVRIVH